MTTIAPDVVRDRVEAGVVWLDQHDPGWWREDVPRAIDLGILDMRRPCLCVLGQRIGNFYDVPITLDQAVGFGFDAAAGGIVEFEALGAEWTRVITERREAAALEGADR